MIHKLANVWGKNKIGLGVKIAAFCDIGHPVIGEGTNIQCHVSIPPGWTIGNNVFIGPGARFANDKHHSNKKNFTPDQGSVGDGACIGMGALILPVNIGEGAIIGAGAVVTKDVAPFTTVVGNPARPLEK
jgi:UDP-2-acetamido-3-amino-2,3-dideoxy-glucuronate N-acetyltransferase